MILPLYLARRFAASFALVLGAFFGVLYFLDFIEQVRRFPEKPLGQTAGLAFLHTPATAYRILPLIMILATIALFLRLARTSELVAIRASGRSALRILVAPVITALCIGAVTVALVNPVVTAMTKRYDTLAGAGGAQSLASIGSDSLWLREGTADGQWVIRADSADPDGTRLHGVSFTAFDATGLPRTRIDARSARLQEGQWIAQDAKEWSLEGTQNPEAGARSHAELALTAGFTASAIQDRFGAPETISVWDLRSFIARLDKAGFSSRRHSVALQSELALPLLLAAMVLVGAGFTMRHTRFGQTGTFVLMALGCGIAIFFLRNFAQVLGESGQIPVILAAWIPPIAAVLLSLSLLLHLEDG